MERVLKFLQQHCDLVLSFAKPYSLIFFSAPLAESTTSFTGKLDTKSPLEECSLELLQNTFK